MVTKTTQNTVRALIWRNWQQAVAKAISRKLDGLEAVGRLYLDAVDREELQAECEQRAGLIAHDACGKLEEAGIEVDEDMVKQIVFTSVRYSVRMATQRVWIADRVIKPSRVRITCGLDAVDGGLDAVGGEYSERDYEQFAGALECWIESRREDNGLGYSVWQMREKGYAVWEAASVLGVGKSRAYEVLRILEDSIEQFARDYAKFVL